ncbi:MAG: DNA adenine methylase [Dehalococcoidia bacterium]
MLIRRIPLQQARDEAARPAWPVVKWVGGKRMLWGQLLRLVPREFGTYFEPFLGGGAVFLALAPGCAVLSDANRDLIDLYHALRDDTADVMAELDQLQPYVLDAERYYAVRSFNPTELPPAVRAARFIYLNKTCYNGLYRVNRKGQFNVPFGRYHGPPQLYDRANLERVAKLLRAADLRCEDFEDTLASAGRGDFAYLDPPYVPLTATANFTRYTKGDFGVADQRRLAEVIHDLDRRGCKVLLSNSNAPLVRELYGRYQIDVVQASRNVNSDSAGRGKIAELTIRNYELDR